MAKIPGRNYQEKRNYIRMKVDAEARVTIESEGNTIEGSCRDLSGGGMLVEIDTPIPVGTSAEVVIASSHGHNPMLKAIAEVNRIESESDANNRRFLVGLQIVEVLN